MKGATSFILTASFFTSRRASTHWRIAPAASCCCGRSELIRLTILDKTGVLKFKGRLVLALKLFGYLGTCFLLLSAVQFIFSFTILKNNHVYFDFFCQLCCGLFFIGFFIDRVVTVETTSAVYQKKNFYYFFLSFLFLLRTFIVILRTTSLYINLQLKVCCYNNKVGTVMNLMVDLLDLLLLVLIANN